MDRIVGGIRLISCDAAFPNFGQPLAKRQRRARKSVAGSTPLDQSRVVSEDAKLIGRVELAEGVRIEPNCVIYGPARIGTGSFIGPNVVLGYPHKTELSDHFSKGNQIQDMGKRGELTIGQHCVVRPGTCIYSDTSVGNFVSFGHNVMIREDVRIGEHALVGTSVVVDGSCEIGGHVSIQTGGYIPTNSKIEDSVFLGPHVVITNDKYVSQKRTDLIGATIREGASIGANSLLMPSIEVGQGAVIGAHSLVLGNVPPRCIFAGVPARKLRDVPSDWRTSLLNR